MTSDLDRASDWPSEIEAKWVKEGLSKETRLVAANELSLQLFSTGEVHVTHKGQLTVAYEPALVILDAFRRPRSLGEVVRELGARTAIDFESLTRTILHLRQQGVLQVEGRAMLATSARVGWDSSSLHVRMLRDEVRTDAFIKAIQETVRPDDVVLDIGTGTGVLAMAAARAGARKVYAVEASSIAEVAGEMFERNGLQDRIELIRGWSTRIALPEKATVLVSETLGNEALAEHIAETFIDAKHRLLVPGARLIPSRVRIWAIPTTMPRALKNEHAFTSENVETWGKRYGMDFRALEEAAAQRPFPLYLNPLECKGWDTLCAPVLLATVDLHSPEPQLDARVAFEIERAGSLDALIIYFDLTLSNATSLDTYPERDDERHWEQPVWVMGRALRVKPGDVAIISYRYQMGTDTIELEMAGPK